MTNTHTPGPWKVDDSVKQGANFHSDVWQIIAKDPEKGWPHTVATIEHYNECPAQDTYIEKNAQLIAAAPDMLEALRAVVSLLKEQYEQGNDLLWCEFDKAEQAIAKATGN